MEPSRSNDPSQAEQTLTIGRYVLHREIARGGMATIHFGRLLGDEGFSRIVAVKRLHAELAQDAQFVAMFLDEARIASRVQHRNVVPVLDVATVGQEVILVQEYVHGVPLDLLLADMRRDEQRLPIDLAVAIACQVLAGLQATHDTVDELGQPMHIVHRDVSPQNVMIALDGSARLLDFGIATTGVQSQETSERIYKGKFAYSAPEQLQRAATPQSDVYSASVLLWELLVGERMHGGKKGIELVPLVLQGALPRMSEALAALGRWDALSELERAQLELLEPVVEKGLAVDLSERWQTAREMEETLAACVVPASAHALAEWAKAMGHGLLAHRARILALEEQSWRKLHPSDSTRPSDPGALGSVRIARNSIPPEGSGQAAPMAKGIRPGHVALIAGSSVALALAIALLLPSPARWFDVPTRTDARRSAEARPAASRAPALEVPPPQEAPQPAAVAPLDSPTRPMAVAPRRSVDALGVGAAQSGARVSVPPAPADVMQRATLNAPRAIRGPITENVAPPAAPTAKQSGECDVPYYYEGRKKVFKNACI